MILQAAVTGSEKLWAEHGLTGLVIFALLGIIVYLVRTHQTSTKKWLDDEREERKYTTERHCQSTDKLSGAIDRLAESFRNPK